MELCHSSVTITFDTIHLPYSSPAGHAALHFPHHASGQGLKPTTTRALFNYLVCPTTAQNCGALLGQFGWAITTGWTAHQAPDPRPIQLGYPFGHLMPIPAAALLCLIRQTLTLSTWLPPHAYPTDTFYYETLPFLPIPHTFRPTFIFRISTIIRMPSSQAATPYLFSVDCDPLPDIITHLVGVGTPPPPPPPQESITSSRL